MSLPSQRFSLDPFILNSETVTVRVKEELLITGLKPAVKEIIADGCTWNFESSIQLSFAGGIYDPNWNPELL